MNKLAIFVLATLFLMPYGFAETSGTEAPLTNANTGFDIDINSTSSGTASINVHLDEAKHASTPTVIDKNREITTVTKQEKDATLPYTIDYSYPQISGENLSASARQFNQLVLDMVNNSVQQFKNYVKADMPHMQTLPDSLKHNSFRLDYRIDVLKPEKQTLISLRLSIEGMQAGRAHPYHTHQVLNYDLNRGKVLSLKDLFKPRAKYLNALSTYSNTALNNKLQDKWMIKDGTAPLPKNYLLWNLEDKGILITFEEYQVAPYADGPQEIEVPYGVLKNLIAHNAPIARCVKGSPPSQGCQ